MSFKNKVVLITGGSSGIGAATAVLFAKEAASVTIVGRNQAKLTTIAEKCQKVGKKPLSINADMQNEIGTKSIVQKVIEKFGKLDILINNAGITAQGRILKGNLLEDYDRVMNVNLRAPVLLTVLAAPHLIKTKGNIVNVSSIMGMTHLRRPTVMTYAISKAGLDHFTRGAALELYRSGVRVNAVSPGLTKTDILMNSGINVSWKDVMISHGVDQISDPEEVADLIAYLASDKAKSITGANYTIDCGAMVTNN